MIDAFVMAELNRERVAEAQRRRAGRPVPGPRRRRGRVLQAVGGALVRVGLRLEGNAPAPAVRRPSAT